MRDYAAFIDGKAHDSENYGFEPTYLPDWLFGFQASRSIGNRIAICSRNLRPYDRAAFPETPPDARVPIGRGIRQRCKRRPVRPDQLADLR